MHILNALGGLVSPPTSKPIVSATTRVKLRSNAAINRYAYNSDDLPNKANGSQFVLFGTIEENGDGEPSADQHE